jgi:hypothetical protein
MSSLAVHPFRPRTRHDTPLDNASRVLLRSVMTDSWQPEEAARDLLRRLEGDSLMLRLLRARVSRALLTRPTRIAARAAATLDLALTEAADDAAATVPRQQHRHA